MITLGVDPGTHVTGWGIVGGDIARPVCEGFGIIRASPKAQIAQRLHQVYEGLRKVIGEHAPTHLALEEAFFAANAQNALKLGMARGVIMLAAQEAGLLIFEYSPLTIKQTVTGYGRAEKEQVRAMVKIQLNMKEAPGSLDASDALATAICHLAHHREPIVKTGAGR